LSSPLCAFASPEDLVITGYADCMSGGSVLKNTILPG
jgi:hypothetical protein